jgi:hypothetical protein
MHVCPVDIEQQYQIFEKERESNKRNAEYSVEIRLCNGECFTWIMIYGVNEAQACN